MIDLRVKQQKIEDFLNEFGDLVILIHTQKGMFLSSKVELNDSCSICSAGFRFPSLLLR